MIKSGQDATIEDMDYQEALRTASEAVLGLKGHKVDSITVKQPRDIQAATDLSKIVSKLSPMLGNFIEYAIVQYLNTLEWPEGCLWKRQDPGFPDAIMTGLGTPSPGIEIKTWFPLATEITARFRDSEQLLTENQTNVAMVCWLPEFIISGQAEVIGVWVGDALGVARTRDARYHNPPRSIVMEPENTTARTVNLQQTNCAGQSFQGSKTQLGLAEELVSSWGPDGKTYKADAAYQDLLRDLTGRFVYRLDTNFAKMDRMGVTSLETFKQEMLASTFRGRTVQQWRTGITRQDPTILADLINTSAPPEVE